MRVAMDFLSVSIAADVQPLNPCGALQLRLTNVDAAWTLTQALATSLREQLAEAGVTIRTLESERSEILEEMKENECL